MCNACQTATATGNDIAANPFVSKMLGIMNSAGLALMISLGHRSGLFDALGDSLPVTSLQLAEKANLNERYVREWLGAMTTGGIVTYDAALGTYLLPPDHAAFLTRASVPQNLASGTQWIPLLASVEDQVLESFRNGGGVPYSSYRRFNEVMAEESLQTVVMGLKKHILPLLPEVQEALTQGIDVLDVGCGAGQALLEMAAMYPQSRFTGYEFSEEAVVSGQKLAESRGLTNATFAVRDISELDGSEQFDFITSFDVIHDQAKPDEVLASIRRTLRSGGTYLMQDIRSSSKLEKNMDHLIGPYLYTVSCMHCMTVSLALGGAGLGTMWGEEKAREMLAEAGFDIQSVSQLPHDIVNNYYICR